MERLLVIAWNDCSKCVEYAAGAAWDTALDALVEVTRSYAAAVVGLFALHPPASVIQQIENARSQAINIIGHRLGALINVPNQPPFFPEHLAKFVNHLPETAAKRQ